MLECWYLSLDTLFKPRNLKYFQTRRNHMQKICKHHVTNLSKTTCINSNNSMWPYAKRFEYLRCMIWSTRINRSGVKNQHSGVWYVNWADNPVDDRSCYLKVTIICTQAHRNFTNCSYRIHHIQDFVTKGVCWCQQQRETCSNSSTVWHHLALSVTSAPRHYSPWSHKVRL